jgi:formylglycine-generating enzyme required for sulfatase activity
VTQNFFISTTVGTQALSSRGYHDIYVAKFDNKGGAVWATAGGGGNDDYGTAIDVDNAGNVYLAGTISREWPTKVAPVFGTTTLSVGGEVDLFVAKLDNSGRFIWVRSAGSTETRAKDGAQGIAVGSGGNVYITGQVGLPATFGTITLTPSDKMDVDKVFVAKLTPGGKFDWVTGSREGSESVSLALDGADNSYITGYFFCDVSFGTLTLSYNCTYPGPDQLFVAKLNPAGKFTLAFQGGAHSIKIDVDRSDNIYVLGDACVGWGVWKIPTRALGFTEQWLSLPAGSFTMGSPTTEPCRGTDEAQHRVTLTRKLEVLSTEVSEWRFHERMGYLPAKFTACGPARPVETVSWYEAAAYCNVLSREKGLTPCYTCSGSGRSIACAEAAAYKGAKIYACPGYRLPTEAEWEYLYRAGTRTALYNGNLTLCSAKDHTAEKIAWFRDTSSGRPRFVATKKANAWGLYDMAGNAAEWVNDRYQASLGTTAVTDPWGSPTAAYRVVRGGGYASYAAALRAAARDREVPAKRSSNIGFRCVRSVKP